MFGGNCQIVNLQDFSLHIFIVIYLYELPFVAVVMCTSGGWSRFVVTFYQALKDIVDILHVPVSVAVMGNST